MDTEREHTELLANPSMSRRIFLALTATVGALTFEGSAFGGRILAFADEAGNHSFIITVIGRENLMVIAAEPQTNKAVANMAITITSANGNEYSAVTDETGILLFNARALSMQADDDYAQTYSFYADITAEQIRNPLPKTIYYPFKESNHLVICGRNTQGGALLPNLVIPCLIDDGIATVTGATFDGLDVKYHTNTFFAGPENDAVHEMVLDIVGTENMPYTAYLLNTSKIAPIDWVTSTTDAQGKATLTLKGDWLKNLTSKDGLKVSIRGHGDAYVFTPLLKLTDYYAPQGFGEFESTLCPSNPDPSSSGITGVIPDMFFIKDTPFTTELPKFPVKLFRDASGRTGITVTVGGWYKDYDFARDKWKEGGWKWSNAESFTGVFDRFEDDINKSLKNMTDAGYLNGDVDKAFGSAPAMQDAKFSFTVSIKALSGAEPDEENLCDVLTTSVYAVADLRLTYSETQGFWAGPVPVYLSGDFTANATLSVGVTFTDIISRTGKGTTFSLAPIDGANFNIVVAIRIELGVGLGVGIPGIVTVGVRGYGSIEYDCTFIWKKDKPCPHHQLFYEVGIQLTMQLLFFHYAWTLCSTGKTSLVDNWSDKAQLEDPGKFKFLDSPFGAAPEMLSDANKKLTMITDDTLEAAAEFSATVNSEGVVTGFSLLDSARSATLSARAAATTPVVGIRDPYGDEPYDPAKGIKPSYQELLYKDVFSDPRGNMFVADDGTAYLFRIALVNVELDSSNDSLEMVTDGTSRFFRATTEGISALPKATADGAPSYATATAVASFIDTSIATEDTSDGTFSTSKSALGSDALSQLASVDDGQALTAASATSAPRGRLVWSSCPHFSPSEGGTWSEPQVIDFALPTVNIASLRSNISDVDFSVCLGSDGNFHIALTSITRPIDEDEDLETQFKKQFVTYLRFNPTAEAGKQVDRVTTTLAGTHTHWSWNPTVQFVSHDRDTRSQRAIISFQQVTTWKDALTHYTYTYHSLNLMKIDENEIVTIGDCTRYTSLELNQNGVLDMVASWPSIRNEPVCLMAWSYPGDEDGSNARVGTWCYNGTSSDEGSKIYADAMRAMPGCVNGGVPGFVIIGKQPGVENKQVVTAGLYTDGAYSMESGFSRYINVLTAPDGSGLYAVALKEGNVSGLGDGALQAINEDPDTVVFGNDSPFCSDIAAYDDPSKYEGGVVRQYQVLYSPFDANTQQYLGFYPLAQLDFAPDSVMRVEENEDAITVVFSNITDIDACKADIYRVIVNKVKCLQMIGFCSTDTYAGIGDDCHVQVTVRNAGNVPINSFKLELRLCDDEGIEPFETIEMNHLASCVVEDANCLVQVLDDDGNPTGEYEKKLQPYDEKGLLWPGTTRTYMATFKVPRDWDLESVEVFGAVSSPTIPNTSTDALGLSFEASSVIDVEPPTKVMSASLAELPAGMSAGSIYVPNMPIDSCVYTPAPTPAKKLTLRVPTGIKAVSKKKRQLRITWNNTRAVKDGASGYQLRYRKAGTKSWKTKKIKGAKTRGVIIKKLKSRKKYQFQLRAIGAGGVHSSWTKIRKRKIK